MNTPKNNAYKVSFLKYFTILILAFLVIPNTSKSEIIDSLKRNLSNNKFDTAYIRKSLIELQKLPFLGSKKADSLVAIIEKKAVQEKFQLGIALSYRYFGLKSFNAGDYKSSALYFRKSLALFNELGDSVNITASTHSLSSTYFNMGKQDSAIYFCTKIINTFRYRNDLKNLAAGYNTLGGIYWSKGDFSGAADAFYKSLDIKVKMGDSLGIANTYNNIGILFDSQQKLTEALEMYNKSYEIYKRKGVKRGIGRACNNIAIVLKNLNRFGEAIEMFLRSLEIDKSLGNADDQAKTLNNIGQLYLQMGDGNAALNYFRESRAIFQKIKNFNGETASVINHGTAYFAIGNYSKAALYFDEGLAMAKKIKLVELIQESYQRLYQLNKKIGNATIALRYHEAYTNLSDSLRSVESINKLDELKIKYETNLKETEIILLNTNDRLRKLEIEKQKAVSLFLGFLSGVLLLMVVLIGYGWIKIRRDNQDLLLKNNEINQQKEEIESQRDMLEDLNLTMNEQNDEILTQRDQIEFKNTIISASNRRLTENIEYASRIQNALLPDLEQIKGYFSNYYIFYQPKDIVSGDFYWMWPQNDKIYFSVADCTGHGVSGAFMSILAYTFLKDSIISKGLTNPNEIVSFIRNEVENNLYNNIARNEVTDGMDIVVCCYDSQTKVLEYSGAHSAFYHIRKDSLDAYKTDRYSIGSRINQSSSFTNQQIQLQIGDRLMFFTDGYMDQLSRDRKTKIGGTNFRQLIQSSMDLTLEDQKIRVQRYFEDWKGEYEQIDDVLIFCLEV